MNIPEMKRNTVGPGVGLLLLFCLAGVGHSCVDPESAYRLTGIVCRLTYPAAVVCEFQFFVLTCSMDSFSLAMAIAP